MAPDKRQETALFRYQVIAPLVTQEWNRVQYGLLLQEVARQEYSFGERSGLRIGRRTIQRWVQLYRQQGLAGLEPAVRSNKHVRKVVAPSVLDQAIALRREVPGRSVEQVIAILEMSGKVERGTLKRSTLNEHLVRAGRTRAAVVQAAKRRPSLRRWEAPHRNAVWQGDAKSGYWLPHPTQPGKRRQVHLLAWIDDYSRLPLSPSTARDAAVPTFSQAGGRWTGRAMWSNCRRPSSWTGSPCWASPAVDLMPQSVRTRSPIW